MVTAGPVMRQGAEALGAAAETVQVALGCTQREEKKYYQHIFIARTLGSVQV